MSKSFYCPKKCPHFDEGFMGKFCRKYNVRLELGSQRTLNGRRFAKKCSECKKEALKDGNGD